MSKSPHNNGNGTARIVACPGCHLHPGQQETGSFVFEGERWHQKCIYREPDPKRRKRLEDAWQLCVQAATLRKKIAAAQAALKSPSLNRDTAASRIEEFRDKNSDALVEVIGQLRRVAAPPQPAVS